MRLIDIENAGNRALAALVVEIGHVYDALLPWAAISLLIALPVAAFELLLAGLRYSLG